MVVQKMVDFQNGTTIYNSSGANTIGGPMTLEAGYCTFDVGSGTSLSITNALTGTGVFYQTTDAEPSCRATVPRSPAAYYCITVN